MRVLVTGGLGVNGSWVLRTLLENGHEAVCFDYSTDSKLVQDISDKLCIVKGDISDIEGIKTALRENQIDSIIHMAALVSPEVTSVDPTKANAVRGFEINARGTLNVLEAARLCNIRKVVYTSSKGVYGEITGRFSHPNYVPLTEDYPKNPASIYDVTKLFGENIGAVYSRIYGIDFTALRFAHIYGPGKLERHGPLSTHDRIIMNASSGTPTKVESGGETRDDLIYVKDVSNAHVLALNAKKPPHIAYHFGTGKAVSLIEFGHIVHDLFPNSQIEIGSGLGYYGKNTIGTQCALDCSLAKEELGFEAHYDIRKGVKDYVSWIGRG
ncbi:MAG: NAD-dependent epimerase/dehydratase family protein [Nitrososphaerales archaeon]